MDPEHLNNRAQDALAGRVIRPAMWRRQDRHIILGVSHPSDDPSRHRVFEVRATFDATLGGWVAQVGEQDLNEQRGEWAQAPAGRERMPAFPTAADCLGHATAAIVASVEREAQDDS